MRRRYHDGRGGRRTGRMGGWSRRDGQVGKALSGRSGASSSSSCGALPARRALAARRLRARERSLRPRLTAASPFAASLPPRAASASLRLRAAASSRLALVGRVRSPALSPRCGASPSRARLRRAVGFAGRASASTPASASNPAGCSGLVSRPGASGALGRERQRFERARQRVGAGFRVRWPRRGAPLRATASRSRGGALAGARARRRLRPSSAAICALRSRSPLFISRS